MTQRNVPAEGRGFPPRQELVQARPSNLVALNDYEPPLAVSAIEADKDDDEIDLRQLWQVIRRRKNIVFTLFVLIFLLSAIITFSMTPIYRAGVTIEIDTDDKRVLDYDVAANDKGSASNSKDFYQTHYELLKSRNLADRVINRAGLESKLRGTDETLAKPFYAEWLEQLSGGQEQTAAPVKADSPLADRFLSKVTIQPVKNSKIVGIYYDDPNPEEAASIANNIAESYIQMNLERRAGATEYAKNFLEEQLVLTKSKLEESETKLVAYAKASSIIDIGGENLTEQTLSGLNAALAEAERARIAAESKYQQANSATMASKVLDSPTIQSLKQALAKLEVDYQSAGVNSNSSSIADTMVDQLKQELAKLEADYQQKREIYKPDYPLMVQAQQKINEVQAQIQQRTTSVKGGMKQKIDELQAQLKRETTNIREALKSDYLEAKQKEAELRTEMGKQTSGLLDLRDKRISYNTLQREVETNRNVYEGLLQRMKEVGVASGAVTNNIAVVDPAIIPYAVHKPNKKLNLALGAVLGLFLGVVAAFLLEFLDDRIKNKDDIERLLHIPLLGVAPAIKRSGNTEYDMMTAEKPTSAVAEAFRSLRTNLLFATRTGAPRLLNVTSAGPGEGKSSTIINLATAFAQAGNRVLLIDGDLRKPTLHKRFKLDNTKGFVHFLTGQESLEAVTQATPINNVRVVTSGPIPPNPVELLSSEHLRELALQTDAGQLPFDIIMIDAPPVLGLADALIIGNHTHATLLITAYSETRKQPLQAAFERLRQARNNILGVIMTKAKSNAGDSSYYNYEYYYSYGHDGGEEGNGRTPKKSLSGKKAA
ncbi:MAG: hypothetical protein BWK73_24545 [Thiothrix lacustris]|uniref:non-specific protein-tyrosine kinase n=1 Tax=Thiothrix lacustris TaxID=525917 RepID=A0A1Y1QLS8_9GAMM|nr:MAG: hypothetical protein BWK73_24545 [Thiothrix lacustris]